MSERARTHNSKQVRVLALTLAAAGCVEADAGARAVVHDSAGMEIVTNTAVARAPMWRLDDTPEVGIGVLEGRPEEQLFRVTSALRLEDGRIAIANAGTNEIRFFDAAGRFLMAVGRKGEGPGEFSALGALHRAGADTLLTHDFQLRRISIFTADGAFVRSFTLPTIGAASWPLPVGAFSDGTLLLRLGRVFFAGEAQPGASRDPVSFYRMDLTGKVLDSLGTFPGSEAFVQTFERGAQRGLSVTSVLFGRSPVSAAVGDQFYYGASDSYELAVHGKDGRLLRLIRLERPNRAVTPDDVQRARQQQLEGVSDENARRQIESRFTDMPIPSAMPAYGALHVDAAGSLWVQEYRPPGEETNAWLVFDPSGHLLGTIQLPPRFSPLQIGSDHLIGRRMDELDVERVEVYRIRKEGV